DSRIGHRRRPKEQEPHPFVMGAEYGPAEERHTESVGRMAACESIHSAAVAIYDVDKPFQGGVVGGTESLEIGFHQLAGHLVGEENSQGHAKQDNPAILAISTNDQKEEKKIKWNPCLRCRHPHHKGIQPG